MIEDWINQNIDDTIKYTGNGKEVHFSCPVCNETRSRMYVNLNSGMVYCHNCGFKGTIVTLIQHVEGVSWSKAMLRFSQIKGNLQLPENVSNSVEDKLFLGDLRKDLEKRAIPLPDEYQILTGSNNMIAKRAVRYLHKRKITDAQIEQYEFGFCSSGDYKDRIIIPIKENDELRFWVARAIGNVTYMKEKSPSNEDYQISKSEVIFNIDVAAREYHTAVISEGIFDAMSWGNIGVSLLGKALYDEQIDILLDYRELLTDGLYVAVDYDARSSATEIAEKLSDYFKVKIINIPKEYDDPNKYLQKHNRKAMWKLIREAEDFSEFSGLKRRLMG